MIDESLFKALFAIQFKVGSKVSSILEQNIFLLTFLVSGRGLACQQEISLVLTETAHPLLDNRWIACSATIYAGYECHIHV